MKFALEIRMPLDAFDQSIIFWVYSSKTQNYIQFFEDLSLPSAYSIHLI
jgi:hypothetical protein